MKRQIKRTSIGLSVLFVVFAVASASGAQAEPTSSQDVYVAAARQAFAPGQQAPVVMTRGSHLHLFNADLSMHSLTSVSIDANGEPLFDTGGVSLAASVAVNGADRLDVGDYTFACVFHTWMVGTLKVV